MATSPPCWGGLRLGGWVRDFVCSGAQGSPPGQVEVKDSDGTAAEVISITL